MARHDRVRAQRVTGEAARRHAVAVLRATYLDEKRWITDPEAQLPPEDLARGDIAWFLVSVRDRAAGVVRVHYDPPLAQYAKYRLQLLDPAVRVEDFIRRHRIAEIGRFAVVPRYRRRFTVAAALMRAATIETVARGYTHFVTDVFEDDPHSPYVSIPTSWVSCRWPPTMPASCTAGADASPWCSTSRPPTGA